MPKNQVKRVGLLAATEKRGLRCTAKEYDYAMRHFARILLSVWFATASALAQSCAAPAQSADYSSPSANSYPAASSSAGASAADPYNSGSADSSATHFDASGYTANRSESSALTSYLKQHKLPLVGGQVLDGPGGQRAVVLYGYVGSDFGKADAVTKTHGFMTDSSITVDNRIQVRPELLASTNSHPAPVAPGPSAAPSRPESANSAHANGDLNYPGADQYSQDQASGGASPMAPYQGGSGPGISAGGSSMAVMVPLALAVLGMALASGSGGNSMSFGNGSFPGNSYPGAYGPYGSSPYPPSYGYPPSNPYGGPPYSPYGPPPYGTSPYGP
jgi:hypothetical protein